MSFTDSHARSRRAFLGFMTTAALAGMTTQVAARGGSNASVINRVPSHFSLRKFTSLSAAEVYRVAHASRLGRHVTIGDFSASESREILRNAEVDWPTTRASLLR